MSSHGEAEKASTQRAEQLFVIIISEFLFFQKTIVHNLETTVHSNKSRIDSLPQAFGAVAEHHLATDGTAVRKRPDEATRLEQKI